MKPSAGYPFLVGDRVIVVTDERYPGKIEAIRSDGLTNLYTVKLDKPIEHSLLVDLYVARAPELERDMAYPRVNLNGTSKGELMEQLESAINLVIELDMKLAYATPHGRDYQTLSSEKYEQARAEHNTRRQLIFRVHRELLDIALNIDEQQGR